jgi:hypothetical protein
MYLMASGGQWKGVCSTPSLLLPPPRLFLRSSSPAQSQVYSLWINCLQYTYANWDVSAELFHIHTQQTSLPSSSLSPLLPSPFVISRSLYWVRHTSFSFDYTRGKVPRTFICERRLITCMNAYMWTLSSHDTPQTSYTIHIYNTLCSITHSLSFIRLNWIPESPCNSSSPPPPSLSPSLFMFLSVSLPSPLPPLSLIISNKIRF